MDHSRYFDRSGVSYLVVGVMSEQVIAISLPWFLSRSEEKVKIQIPSREVIIVALILAVLQVLDGVLTGIGVYQFGVSMEGNILLRSLMESIGAIPALVLAKVVAICVVISLAFLSSVVVWVNTALRAMVALYLIAAIIPWSAILITHFI